MKTLEHTINEMPKVINKNGIELVETEATVSIDPNTGRQTVIGPKDETESSVSITDDMNKDIKLIEDKELVKNANEELKAYGLSDEDAAAFLEVITRFEDGQKITIHDLPQTFKNMVFTLCPSHKIADINNTVKAVLNEFISQMKIDKEYVDLQKAIKKELQVPGIVDMFGEHQKEVMEKDLLDKAKELEEKELYDTAETLKAVSREYTSSYEFDKFFKAFKDEEDSIKRLDKGIKRYHKICEEFNFKYENNKTKFKINDVTMAGQAIGRHLKEEDTEDVMKFIILFCRICKNYDPNNVPQHTFMYYTIKNILSLDYIDIKNEVYTETINKIKSIINLIKERATKEAANKKKKGMK